jgi:hypothetical protein
MGLGAVGGLMALTTGHTFRVSTLAQRLRSPGDPAAELNLTDQIPAAQAPAIVAGVRRAFPQIRLPKPLANIARQVWERMHVRPPGVAASIGLLALYAVALPAAPLAMVVFERPVRTVASRTDDDGTITPVEELRVWGQLRAWTELNSDGRYHGRHVEFAPQRGRKTVEGAFVNGEPDGVWKFYGPDGRVQSTAVFERGLMRETTGRPTGIP